MGVPPAGVTPGWVNVVGHELEDDDLVGFSFFFAEHLMLAAGIWFLSQGFLCPPLWASTKICAACVMLVAFWGYKRMAHMWVGTKNCSSVQRYADWWVTVPLQILEFYLMLMASKKEHDSLRKIKIKRLENRKFINEAISSSMMLTGNEGAEALANKMEKLPEDTESEVPNLVSHHDYRGVVTRLMGCAICMLLCGFMAETPRLEGVVNRWLFFFAAATFWCGIVYELTIGPAHVFMVELGDTMSEDSRGRDISVAFRNAQLIVTIGWALYPAGFLITYMAKEQSESDFKQTQDTLNAVYNFADVVNKLVFAIVVYMASAGYRAPSTSGEGEVGTGSDAGLAALTKAIEVTRADLEMAREAAQKNQARIQELDAALRENKATLKMMRQRGGGVVEDEDDMEPPSNKRKLDLKKSVGPKWKPGQKKCDEDDTGKKGGGFDRQGSALPGSPPSSRGAPIEDDRRANGRDRDERDERSRSRGGGERSQREDDRPRSRGGRDDRDDDRGGRDDARSRGRNRDDDDSQDDRRGRSRGRNDDDDDRRPRGRSNRY